jgi:hypothetical protein
LRWCGGCAKAHAGAVNIVSQKCEGCQLKLASFGLPAEGKNRRWCAGCAKGHAGAVNVNHKRSCEDCGAKVAGGAAIHCGGPQGGLRGPLVMAIPNSSAWPPVYIESGARHVMRYSE